MRRVARWVTDWRNLAAVTAGLLVAVLAVSVVEGLRQRNHAVDALGQRDRQLAMLRRQLGDRDAAATAERARLNERVDQLLAALRSAGITPPPEQPAPGSTTVVVTPPTSSTSSTTTTTRPTTTSTSSTTTTTRPTCRTLPITDGCSPVGTRSSRPAP